MNIQKPTRVSRTFTQTIHAPPEKVFPLYCPVREGDWIDGWSPEAVYSHSGVAEPDCVFVTRSEGKDAVWVVTAHDPDDFHVQMWKIVPGVTACKLDIRLEPGANDRTAATITYTHTSLGPDGDDVVAKFTQEYYDGFMSEWEARMNHYLATGKALKR